MSIGTHLRHFKDRVATATQTAARALPQIEFHFTDGRVDASHHTREDNFQRLGFVHYDLIPRYDLVVHHAGTGVMSETIAAGVPAIALPLDYDQFDYAARLSAAGLALRMRTLDDMPRLIERALTQDASADARRRFRELALSQSADERVCAMVREHFGQTTSHLVSV